MSDRPPLAHLKIIDLTRVRAGPTAARQFADWGADVIMIEPVTDRGDSVGSRHGSDFQNLHRNKRSLTLDLRDPAGREVLNRLVRDADVLLENFRPDVKHRLGIDYATLRQINPGLVYASISGFGQDGPYRDRPGLDQIAQGMGGLMSITGLPGQGPVRAGIAVADTAAGLFCTIGIMTALLERQITGEGRWVKTSLLQAQVALLDFQAARWLIDGVVPPQDGNHHPTALPPMGLYATADGHVNLAVLGPAMFAQFCAVAAADHLLADERFSTPGARHRNRGALNEEIAAIMLSRSTADWIERLNAAGVACGPVNSIDEVFADPQVRHLKMSRTVDDPDVGPIDVVGQAIEIDGVQPAYRTRAPGAGQHTAAILASLGYSEAEIADLRQRNIV
jgi:crotonobetainyl-CoA:carnitine CoA-transferase CaiB-like acyl-CoA transferase